MHGENDNAAHDAHSSSSVPSTVASASSAASLPTVSSSAVPSTAATFARRRLLRQAILVATTSIVSLVVLAVLSVGFARDYDSMVSELVDSAALRATLDRTLQSVVDAETAQRGYVLTGNDAFLEPLERRREDLPATLGRLRELLRSKGLDSMQSRLDRAVEQRMEFTETTIVLARTEGREVARARIATGDGKRHTDEIRALVASLEASEDARVTILKERAEGARLRAIAVFGALVGVAMAIGAYGVVLVRRELRALDENAQILERAERRARESEARFRQLADRSHDFVRVLDPEGRALYTSPSSRALLGYAPEELASMAWQTLLPEDERDRVGRWRAEAIARGEAVPPLTHRILRRDGAVRWFETRLDALRDPRGKIERFHVVSRDVTNRIEEDERRRTASEQLERLAERDELTGLLNRRGFLERGDVLRARACEEGRPLLLAFCDVNGLKTINDRLGHEAGDGVIRDAARLLAEGTRSEDVVARIGGDELVVLAMVRDEDAARVFHERLLDRVRTHNENAQRAYRVSVSFGATLWPPDDARTLDDVVRAADAAMYADKEANRVAAAAVVRTPNT